MRVFSSTDSSGKMLVIWNVREMPRRQRAGAASAVTSSPRKSTRPAVGASSPEIRWNSVVLPAPFGPMTARSSPGSTAKLTPSTACRAPKARPSPRASEHRRLGHPRATRASRRAVPTRPPGRKITIRTNTTPVKIIQCSV